ncbi:MAG TPA: fatty acid desaturase [Longimicrobiales bacterium]|nr:fatty acid desaturase [Longimicrobiales bacterium]
MSEHAKPDRAQIERWNAILRPYWGADTRRSVTQLLTTAVPFALLWYAMLRSLEVGFWLTLLLAVPTAGFMMRLFMIQHDCGHGSFFGSKRARDWVGRCIGVLLLTPYEYWRKTHAYHHAHSGDLDFRGFGDIDTHTVREYLSWPRRRRIAYRIYRHPVLLFTVGPLFHFLVKHRYPWDIPRDWKQAWRSVWMTNLAIAAILAVAWATIGLQRFLLVQGPLTFIASSLGVWLFYVQHQFEHTYWQWHRSWDYYEASLYGSSYLVLPKPLQWITASIGVHHVHHMSARIPNYKLQQVHDENPEFHVVSKVTLKDTWHLVNLTLWDEEHNRLIRFKDLRNVDEGRAAA